MTPLVWVGIGVLGGAGALARFGLDGFIGARAGGGFPWGTLAVNLTGALTLGVLTALALHGKTAALLEGGLLGSYTTFSTWMLESDRSVEGGQVVAAALNVLLSLAAGLGAVALGRLVGGAL